MKKYYLALMMLVNCAFFNLSAQQKKALTLEDVMKFKQIRETVISDNGSWLAYSIKLDRGNGELIIQSSSSERKYSVERGIKPIFSLNEQWLSTVIEPDFIDLDKSEKDRPRNNLGIINLKNGVTETIVEVKSSEFTKNSGWIAVHFFEKKDTSKNAKPKKNIGSRLLVKNLTLNFSDTLDFVHSYSIDSLSNYIAYSVSDTNKNNNGLYFYDLKKKIFEVIDKEKNSFIDGLKWNKDQELLYTKTFLIKDDKKDSAVVYLWSKEKSNKIAESSQLITDWYIPSENTLNWTEDGTKIFFGIKPVIKNKKAEPEKNKKKNPYDFEEILSKSEIDVWHWNDPLIKSNEIKEWKSKEKFSYTTLFDKKSKRIIYLTDLSIPNLIVNKNNNVGLLSSEIPYQKLKTWDGNYADYYVTDYNNGEKNLVARKLSDRVYLSPHGKYVLFFERGDWYIYSIKSRSTKNITENVKANFADEDNDTPSEPNSYGIGGWTKEDESIFIYDKYDIWKYNTESDYISCLTDHYGRQNKLTLRIQKLDKDKQFYDKQEQILLTGFNHKTKSTNLFSANITKKGINTLTNENKKYSFTAKAAKSDKIIFTRESYDEYPDLWFSTMKFENPIKVTDLNSQLEKYAWGSSTLIEWNSIDGKKLDGAVILPTDFAAGKKYPVLIYFYEISSHRVHEFNEMVVNHRPNFPFYASNEYIIFLPDVKYDVARPGYSAIKCIMPGIQKLIDLGWADPNGIALHGHSWGGYQTAFMVTQTDLFACAIAGAPVGNMTSAYSGIRWGTGLARQFQYEKSQSRIGGTLWNKTISYIENSPVFFADKINTPLLLMHGDEDDAVPWYQSIEIYLALRRLGKDCIFLQYRKEPHHPRKYANKLDYSIKMKEYIDFYCKGASQPEWIKNGIPYNGN